MLKMHYTCIIATLLFWFGSLFGQEDLDIFGYFQVNFTQMHEVQDLSNPDFNFVIQNRDDRNSFMVQQANVFLRKEINSDLTAWVNFEIKNSFSSEHGWGHFNLEEAWVKYNHNQKFNLKAGLLIPKFNNLLQVKNRTPYLPYIMRPFVYETSVSDLLPVGDFVPEKAYFQIYGTFFTGTQIEYAAFVGNSEADFISSEATYSIRTGEDTTTAVTVGGRLGLRREKLKFGVSFTRDRDHQYANGLGAVPRWRIGTDLSFTYQKFWFEGEMIAVRHKEVRRNVSLDKLFYYTTLGYDFSERIFAFTSYNYIKDNFTNFLQKGIEGFYIGGGFRPNEALVLKAQFSKIYITDGELPAEQLIPFPLNLDYDFNVFSVALSVFF